jgi:hypothetical protein
VGSPTPIKKDLLEQFAGSKIPGGRTGFGGWHLGSRLEGRLKSRSGRCCLDLAGTAPIEPGNGRFLCANCARRVRKPDTLLIINWLRLWTTRFETYYEAFLTSPATAKLTAWMPAVVIESDSPSGLGADVHSGPTPGQRARRPANRTASDQGDGADDIKRRLRPIEGDGPLGH